MSVRTGVTLHGANELRARLGALRLTFKDYGRVWGDEAASGMRDRLDDIGAVRTGDTKRSIRRRNATQRKAVVVGSYVTNFIDAGSVAHDIAPKNKPFLIFEAGGRTIFAKKVHKQRIPARRFKRPAALAAIAKHPLKQTMIDLWNKAA